MESLLELQVRSVYGTERIYPINEQARKIAALLGRKTLNKEDVARLQDIGFKVSWVASDPKIPLPA